MLKVTYTLKHGKKITMTVETKDSKAALRFVKDTGEELDNALDIDKQVVSFLVEFDFEDNLITESEGETK